MRVHYPAYLLDYVKGVKIDGYALSRVTMDSHLSSLKLHVRLLPAGNGESDFVATSYKIIRYIQQSNLGILSKADHGGCGETLSLNYLPRQWARRALVQNLVGSLSSHPFRHRPLYPACPASTTNLRYVLLRFLLSDEFAHDMSVPRSTFIFIEFFKTGTTARQQEADRTTDDRRWPTTSTRCARSFHTS